MGSEREELGSFVFFDKREEQVKERTAPGAAAVLAGDRSRV